MIGPDDRDALLTLDRTDELAQFTMHECKHGLKLDADGCVEIYERYHDSWRLAVVVEPPNRGK